MYVREEVLQVRKLNNGGLCLLSSCLTFLPETLIPKHTWWSVFTLELFNFLT